ncbi:MAG: hypothetical protein GXO79_02125 [Chlorobi bacterium]|nr:hypothetical protein [Chlorobiota bacterium]
MKKFDIYLILLIIILFLPFILNDNILSFYKEYNHEHSIITSFIKFAILATLGELIGLRIKTGKYYVTGFGILPRILVWGFLGICIKISFVIFASGTPVFLKSMGLQNAIEIMKGKLSISKIGVAFTTSSALNLIFAPVMMTFHKITDTHILNNGGTLSGFFKPIPFATILKEMDWNIQWNFVFKKTIILFWIPAHTITFLLPADYQVLFAAILGIILGILLAIASILSRNS